MAGQLHHHNAPLTTPTTLTTPTIATLDHHHNMQYI